MSLTIQQIITDAKRLASRLKERDVTANKLLTETETVTRKIDAMKEFQDELAELNDVAKQKSHSELIASIQKENRSLRSLQLENCALRATLEDYEHTIELIMSKYREHTTKQIYESHINFRQLQGRHYAQVIDGQAEKISEMAAVMGKAADLDDHVSTHNEELIARLRVENEGLRQMLHIAHQYNGMATTEDKLIQTDSI